MQKSIISIFLIFSLFSCKKDGDQPGQRLIGDTENMIVTNYNQMISFNDSLEIDVDHDSINDFRFIHLVSSEVLSLGSNRLLMGEYVNDTIFSHLHVSWSQLYQADTVYETIQTNDTRFEHCRAEWDDPVIRVNTNQFRLIPKRYNNPLNKTNQFTSGRIKFFNLWIIRMDQDSLIHHDSINFLGRNYWATIIDVDSYESDYCHCFPRGEVVYIGIKMSKGNKEKLGWIKLSVAENYLVLIQSAIEE